LTSSSATQTATQPIVATCTTPLAVTVGTSVLTGGAPLSSVVLTTRTQDTSMFGGIIRVGDEP